MPNVVDVLTTRPQMLDESAIFAMEMDDEKLVAVSKIGFTIASY